MKRRLFALVFVVGCASSEPKPAVPATIAPPGKATKDEAKVPPKPYDAPAGVPGECVNAPGDRPLPASCDHVGSEPPTRR